MWQLLLIVLLAGFASAGFSLQLASYKQRAMAERAVQDLLPQGYNAFVQAARIPDKGVWHRVRVGKFATKKEALNRKKALMSKGFGDEIIIIKNTGEAGLTDREIKSREVDRAGVKKNPEGIPLSHDPAQVGLGTFPRKSASHIISSNSPVSRKRDKSTPPKGPLFGLILASCKYKESAFRIVRDLVDLNFTAFVDSIMVGNGLWYRAGVGPFASRNKALEQRAMMRSNGFKRGSIPLVSTSGERIVSVDTASNRDIKPVIKTLPIPNSSLDRQVESVPETRSANLITQKTQTKTKRGKPGSSPEKAKATGPSSPIKPEKKPKKTKTLKNRKVTLRWDANKEPDLTGYKVYYDIDPGLPYSPGKADYVDEGPSPIVVGKDITEITLHGLSNNKDYFFSITSYNTKGLESDYSAEIFKPWKSSSLKKPDNRVSKSEHRASGAVQPDIETVRSKNQTQLPAEVTEGLEKTDILEPGDTLQIDVPGQRDMSHFYDIDPDGYIHLLSVGKLYARGSDLAGLKEKLAKKLEKYIDKGENISIKVVERMRYIKIEGGVRYPGWYRVNPLINLDELIQFSGGMLKGVDYNRFMLRRKTLEGYKEIGIKGKIMLKGDDIIVAPFPRAYQKRIDNGDLLFVNIPQRQPPGRIPYTTDSADLRQQTAQNQVEVDKNGYIYIPGHGHIYANGLTSEELKKKIIKKLPNYLALLGKVRVSIIEKKHYIQVTGHVSDPGWHNVSETGNIQSAIFKAGTAVDGAVMSDITIRRKIKGKLKKLRVNLYQYTITGDPRLLMPLHENDNVFVPITSSFGSVKRTLRTWDPPTERLEQEDEIEKKVRIFGAVMNPGIYEPYEGMDLLDIMVLASGERREADLSKIIIIRKNKVEIQFNFMEYLKHVGTQRKGTLKLPKVYHGDTIYIRFVESKTWEPMEDKVFYITGKVEKPNQYKLWDQMTVLQAIALAGGLKEWADEEHITIVRMVAGKQENIPFNYKRGVSGKYPELNIYIQSDDTIIVP